MKEEAARTPIKLKKQTNKNKLITKYESDKSVSELVIQFRI